MTGYKRSVSRRGILEKQKTLRKELVQLNRMRQRKLENEGVISKFERKFSVKQKYFEVVHEKVRGHYKNLPDDEKQKVVEYRKRYYRMRKK